jgi:hypothetical protein
MHRFEKSLITLGDEALFGQAMPPSLRLYPENDARDDKGISVFYAPLQAINDAARVILVGITPGAAQMRAAWKEARRCLQEGVSLDSAMSEVKRLCAFKDERNKMRPNLYAQLDHWGVPAYLGHKSGAALFEEGWSDIQTTSLIPFPAFRHDRNYEGRSPTALKHPFLKSMVDEAFVPILRRLPAALVFPLGVKVASVIRKLVANEEINNPVAYGMLHPSDQNTYRLEYLCGSREDPVPSKTSVAPYDEGRMHFRLTYLRST